MFESVKKKLGSLLSSQELIKPRLNDPLKVGDYVRVQRSDGKLEDGFIITFFNKERGEFVVQKEKGENVTVKRISIKELEKSNPSK